MKKGYFGEFGGCFVPELLMPPLQELEEAMRDIMPSPTFKEELDDLLRNFAGRETPLTYCPTLSKRLGFSLWLKREDLLHTGAHKVNNTLGQALLAKHMGKTALVAETGAGQHGVATAAAAARLGLECIVFMGAEDVERQSSNVRRMKLLGAEVRPVQSGTRTLKDAINEALRYWIAAQETTHYCFGTAAGPHPFPTLVRNLQSVIGRETRAQMLEKTGRLPDVVVAAVGGGSNAIGMFHPFVDDASVRIIGVEARYRRTGMLQFRADQPRHARRPARPDDHAPPDQRRTDRTFAFRFRRARLSRRRTGARLPERHWARPLRARQRRRSARRLPDPLPHRRHPSRAGILPCTGVGTPAPR